MIRRATPLLAFTALAVSACQPADRQANATAVSPRNETAPSPVPIVQPSPTPTAESVMRADVVEAARAPAPAPVPEPFEATIYFDSGQSGVGDDAKPALDSVIAAFDAAPGATIILRGNSDSKGDDHDNKRASLKRAEAVRDYLVAKGLPAERMTTIGLGETRPVAPNAMLDGSDNPEGRRQNRRVDIVVTAAATPTDGKTLPAAP